MKFIRLAFKNIVRNKRRTITTGLIIVFSSMALIVAGGYIKYSYWGLSERAIRGQYGHLQVFNPAFLADEEDVPLQYGISAPSGLIKKINTLDMVRFAMPRIYFMGLISNGDKSVAFTGRAIIPEKEQKLEGFAKKISRGYHLGEDISNQDEDEVILAKGLAKSLKAEIGDYMTLMTSTTNGALNAIDVKVVGLYTTGIPELDARSLNVTLKTGQMLLRTDKVSNIVVVARNTKYTDLIAERLSTLLNGFSIKKWYDMAVFYKAVVKLYNSIFTFLGIIIFVIVFLSTSNTMMMSIFERTKEIGTMMAIGTSKARLLFNFIIEGCIIGVLSGGIGMVLGFLVSFIINHSGIMLPPPPGSTVGYPLAVHYVPSIYAATYAFMLVTSVLSSLIPALKASRMKIVDALGHV